MTSQHRLSCPAFTLIELLVVLTIVGILAALLLTGLQKVRESSARASCGNHLKQIALAVHGYEQHHGVLPCSRRDVRPQRGWVQDLLPFLEQGNLVSEASYDFNEDWWRSTTRAGVPVPNAATVQKHLSMFVCPSTARPWRMQNKVEAPPEQNKVGACGDYFVTEGVNLAINNELPAARQFPAEADLKGVLRKHPETGTWAAVTDGASNTILAGECSGREDVWRGRTMAPAAADRSLPQCARARGGAWASNDNPYEIGARVEWCSGAPTIPGRMKINNSNEYGHLFYSFHAGANVVFADGSVRFRSESTPLRLLAVQVARGDGTADAP